MQTPKSSYDLGDPTGRRNSRRESHVIRPSKDNRDFDFKISNPFRQQGQENCIPYPILSQIQQLEYISTKSIKTIEIPQYKRPSNFMKNLEMMQQLARLQQEKYSGMLRGDPEPLNKNEINPPNNMSPNNICFGPQDDISLELNGFYDYADRIEDDFNLFDDNNCGEVMEEEPVFYSTRELERNQMDYELNHYIG